MSKHLFKNGYHNLFLAAAIFCSFVFFEELSNDLLSSYDMKILKVELVCEQPLNNRCDYQYWVQGNEGKNSRIQINGNLFGFDELVAGNTIKKNKFSFAYEVNGQESKSKSVTYLFRILLVILVLLSVWRYLTPQE